MELREFTKEDWEAFSGASEGAMIADKDLYVEFEDGKVLEGILIVDECGIGIYCSGEGILPEEERTLSFDLDNLKISMIVAKHLEFPMKLEELIGLGFREE